MKTGIEIASEVAVRAMRDRVFGQRISDKEWQNCREHWMGDVNWLVQQCAQLDLPNSPAPSTINH